MVGANLISNNTVINNGRFGIEIKVPTGNGEASGPGSVVVDSNTVTRTITATNVKDYAGIAVFRRAGGVLNADQPSGVVVSANTVSGFHRMPVGSTGDGFGIVVEGLGHVVTGNTVSNNDVNIQIQSNNTADAQNTPGFDRGNASESSAMINGNRILASTDADLRNLGAPTTDATCNAYDNATGPAAAKVIGAFITVPFYVTSNMNVPCGVPNQRLAHCRPRLHWCRPEASARHATGQQSRRIARRAEDACCGRHIHDGQRHRHRPRAGNRSRGSDPERRRDQPGLGRLHHRLPMRNT